MDMTYKSPYQKQHKNRKRGQRRNTVADVGNSAIEKKSSLTVCVRVRPMLTHEINRGSSSIVQVADDRLIVLFDPHDNSDDILRKNRSREKQFAFDSCFSEVSTQEHVYSMTTKSLIPQVINGYNATVFAYGPTGSGKTYTMLGNTKDPGIMSHTLADLFQHVERHRDDIEFKVSMSYVELYNEYLYDLLVEESEELDLREDAQGINHIVGATQIKISSSAEVLALLMEGNCRRTQEATSANATSSRSHAILRIRVKSRAKSDGIDREYKMGELYMCDLAGSERAAHTKNVGLRMVEGQHINRSLLALGNCINSLGSATPVGYVNYRDSKLTRILKHALGGNCRTVMIAHISPCNHHFEESFNTLTYANRAKNIKTRVVRNTEQVQAHIAEYANIISSLRNQIASLQERLHQQPSPSQERNDTVREATETDRSFQTILSLQSKLDDLLTDQLDLYQRLHEIRHQSLEILLNTREQTASALIADNVYELDIFDESSDAKQVVQLVSDQVGLAKHKLRQLESDRRKLLQQIEQGQQQAASILRELQHAHTQDEEVNHVLLHLHGLFTSKLALISSESARTTFQQYLMETTRALEHLQRQTLEQAHTIRQQARLLAENNIEIPSSLQLEQRKSIVDHRVSAAMMAMDRELPLMCLDPEEIIRRKNAQRIQPKRLHEQLHRHFTDRMRTISSLGFDATVGLSQKTSTQSMSDKSSSPSPHDTIKGGLEREGSKPDLRRRSSPFYTGSSTLDASGTMQNTDPIAASKNGVFSGYRVGPSGHSDLPLQSNVQSYSQEIPETKIKRRSDQIASLARNSEKNEPKLNRTYTKKDFDHLNMLQGDTEQIEGISNDSVLRTEDFTKDNSTHQKNSTDNQKHKRKQAAVMTSKNLPDELFIGQAQLNSHNRQHQHNHNKSHLHRQDNQAKYNQEPTSTTMNSITADPSNRYIRVESSSRLNPRGYRRGKRTVPARLAIYASPFSIAPRQSHR